MPLGTLPSHRSQEPDHGSPHPLDGAQLVTLSKMLSSSFISRTLCSDLIVQCAQQPRANIRSSVGVTAVDPSDFNISEQVALSGRLRHGANMSILSHLLYHENNASGSSSFVASGGGLSHASEVLAGVSDVGEAWKNQDWTTLDPRATA
jgi:hypothetical protein